LTRAINYRGNLAGYANAASCIFVELTLARSCDDGFKGGVCHDCPFGHERQGEGKREKGENPNSTFHVYRLAPFAD
jgi:hypothetical protein